MVFLGFGGLMTFLRRYSYSAIAFNYLISAFVILCAPLLTVDAHALHPCFAAVHDGACPPVCRAQMKLELRPCQCLWKASLFHRGRDLRQRQSPSV